MSGWWWMVSGERRTVDGERQTRPTTSPAGLPFSLSPPLNFWIFPVRRLLPTACCSLLAVLLLLHSALALAAAGPHAEVTRRIGELADKDFRVRWYAVYALGQLGVESAAAVGPLTQTLANRQEDEYVRGGAAWALGQIGPGAAAAVPVLTQMLTSQLESVRRNSASALGNLGPVAVAAAPQLVALLRDEDSVTRIHAAVALWQIQHRPESLRSLAQMLHGGQESTRYEAAMALGRLRLDAAAATADLVAALRDHQPDTARAAAWALGQIGPTALASLRPLLSDPDVAVRRGAVESLGWIGSAAIADLSRALKNDSPVARQAAAREIGRLGPDAASAVPALLEAINDRDAKVREEAARALRQIQGPGPHP